VEDGAAPSLVNNCRSAPCGVTAFLRTLEVFAVGSGEQVPNTPVQSRGNARGDRRSGHCAVDHMAMLSAIPSLLAAAEPASIHVKSMIAIERQEFSSEAADTGASEGLELTNIQNRPRRVAIWVAKFQEAELKAVRIAARSAKSPMARFCAISMTKLGNGWLYPFLAILIFVRWGFLGYRIVLLAAVNAALVHCIYPAIKRRFRRMRPYEVDPRLLCLLGMHPTCAAGDLVVG
jgi:hypothetical protein